MRVDHCLVQIFLFSRFIGIFSKGYYCTNNDTLVRSFNHGVDELENSLFTTVSKELTSKLNNSNINTLSFIISPFWLEYLLIGISLGSTGQTLVELNNITHMNENLKLIDKTLMMNCIQKNILSHSHMKLEINNIIFIPNDTIIKRIYYILITVFGKISIQLMNVNDILLSTRLNNMTKKIIRLRLKNIFDEPDLQGNNTSIVIVNSIYFRNRWLYNPTVLNNTVDFKINDGKTEQVKMFRITGIMPFADIKEWDAKVVDIPYVTENISMMIFLPNKVDGLLEMEKRIMENKRIISFTSKLLKNIPISITLPNYSLESTIVLPSKLKTMGINRLFDENVQLNLAFQSNVHVTNIIQHLKLWADKGRGAYKDTGEKELPLPQKLLIADHPFFFILKMNETSFMMGHFTI